MLKTYQVETRRQLMSRHDVTDAEWEAIWRFLPKEYCGKPGRPWTSHRNGKTLQSFFSMVPIAFLRIALTSIQQQLPNAVRIAKPAQLCAAGSKQFGTPARCAQKTEAWKIRASAVVESEYSRSDRFVSNGFAVGCCFGDQAAGS